MARTTPHELGTARATNKPKSQVGLVINPSHTGRVPDPGLVLSSSEGANKVHKQVTQIPSPVTVALASFLDIYGLIEVFTTN